jgi:hypothetical protein
VGVAGRVGAGSGSVPLGGGVGVWGWEWGEIVRSASAATEAAARSRPAPPRGPRGARCPFCPFRQATVCPAAAPGNDRLLRGPVDRPASTAAPRGVTRIVHARGQPPAASESTRLGFRARPPGVPCSGGSRLLGSPTSGSEPAAMQTVSWRRSRSVVVFVDALASRREQERGAIQRFTQESPLASRRGVSRAPERLP